MVVQVGVPVGRPRRPSGPPTAAAGEAVVVVGMVEGDGEGGVVEAGVAGAAATDRAPRGVVLGPQSRRRQLWDKKSSRNGHH